MSEAEIELLLRLDYITGCPQSDLEELGIDASKFDVKEKITNLINKYKEQEEQIEEYKLNVKEVMHEAQENARIFRKEQAKANEYRKMIELMAKDIAHNGFDEDICRAFKQEDRTWVCNDDRNCARCIIEYYKKEARGE